MTIRNFLDRFPYLSAMIYVFIILTFMIVFTACSSPPVTSTTEPVAAQPVDATVKPPAAPVERVAQFGEIYTWTDGVSISVGEPTAFEPTDIAAGVLDGNSSVIFEIVLTNCSESPHSPMPFSTASSGGQQASEIFDIGHPLGDIGTGPLTTLLPGDSVKWYVAYSVLDPESITLEIGPNFDYKKMLFTNRVP